MPPQDHTTGRPGEVHAGGTAGRGAEVPLHVLVSDFKSDIAVPGPRAPAARTTCMNRRSFLGTALAAPVALALDPVSSLGATTGGGVVALATADLESHVVALDITSGRVLKRIRTLEAPRSIESSPFGHVVVAHTPIGAVSILDAATLTVAP